MDSHPALAGAASPPAPLEGGESEHSRLHREQTASASHRRMPSMAEGWVSCERSGWGQEQAVCSAWVVLLTALQPTGARSASKHQRVRQEPLVARFHLFVTPDWAVFQQFSFPTLPLSLASCPGWLGLLDLRRLRQGPCWLTEYSCALRPQPASLSSSLQIPTQL